MLFFSRPLARSPILTTAVQPHHRPHSTPLLALPIHPLPRFISSLCTDPRYWPRLGGQGLTCGVAAEGRDIPTKPSTGRWLPPVICICLSLWGLLVLPKPSNSTFLARSGVTHSRSHHSQSLARSVPPSVRLFGKVVRVRVRPLHAREGTSEQASEEVRPAAAADRSIDRRRGRRRT